MTETAGGPIEPYQHTPASCRAFDPHAGEVAETVAALLRSRLPELQVEHVGSTAIPGCAGKGIIDIMAVYPDGMLEQARAAVDSLGFQPQTFGEPFPENRPMRVGTMRLHGRRYRIHVHVIAASSEEVDALRTFRDRGRLHQLGAVPGPAADRVAASAASRSAQRSPASSIPTDSRRKPGAHRGASRS
ncbi:MAG: GrpB family protein [Chloroflexi bacterium]|nr:MAG: GrpB family protein [Chloroflexota bacterium]